VLTIWRDCLSASGGPFLFGATPGMADAMYAPVCTRFITYDIRLPEECARYVATVMALPDLREWIRLAEAESDELEELEAEF